MGRYGSDVGAAMTVYQHTTHYELDGVTYPSRGAIFDRMAVGEAVEFLCIGTHHKSCAVAKASVRSAVNAWRLRYGSLKVTQLPDRVRVERTA